MASIPIDEAQIEEKMMANNLPEVLVIETIDINGNRASVIWDVMVERWHMGRNGPRKEGAK